MSARFSRALPPALSISLLAGLALLAAFAFAPPADAQTTAVNANAVVWVQLLDDDGNPVDLTRDHWRQPYFNRFTPGATSVKVRVYLLKDTRTGPTAPSPSDYASWSDFSNIWLTLKSASGGGIFGNLLTSAGLYNQDGSAQLVAGNAYQASLAPEVWHQNTAGYASGAATPTGSARVEPMDITIDFGSGGLTARNFFVFTRKNCSSGDGCTGGTGRDVQYEWKLPTRSADLGWGLFARLNGDGDPVVRSDGAAAWDDMHYLNQNSDTTLTVRFYYKATDADNPTQRPNSPSAPDATYADFGYVASLRIYQRDGSLRGNMHNVRYYTVGSTTERWAGCYNNTGIHQCYISKASLKAAATAADATASVDETDTVIPVDFDIVIPNSEVAGYPSVHFFARGGTDADLESGGARWPHGLGLIKRPTLNLHHRRNTWDRGESTCTHDYVAADTAATESAEQLAVIASDTAGGSLGHNCGNLSIAPGQSAFLGFWAGFAGPAAHPQEYFWNRNDNNRLYGWRHSQAMRIRELDRVNVTTRAGSFGVSSRCPDHRYLDAPEGRFFDAEWPKPRTRDGMGSCTSTSVAWFAGSAERAAGTEYVAPAGLGLFTLYPTSINSGTATLTATAYGTDRDGDGEPDWTATDQLGVAFDSSKTTVSASDTFEAGETDDSPLAAYVSRSDYNGLISLKVGRLERHAFPIFPQKPADRDGGAPYATVAELAADSSGDLTWQEGRTKFSDSRGAVLAGNYISPVIFENLAEDEAVRITVDRGVVSHEGEDCTASAGACTLSLSRAELMTSRGRGASGEVGTDARDPFVISYLDYAPAGPGPVTFTVQAFPADNSWTVADPTTYSETVPALPALGIRGALQDADGLLAPGDRTGVTIGVDGPSPPAPGNDVLYFTFGDGIWKASVLDGAGRLIGFSTPAGPPSEALDFARDSYLVISGPATWVASGERRLAVGSGSAFSKLACIDANDLDSSVASGDADTCYVVDGDGERPQLLVDSSAADGDEIRVTARLDAGGAPFNIAVWTADTVEAPSAYQIDSVFGSAAFRVETVTQLASVALTRKDGQTGAVKTGDPARLKLAALNENGRASAADAITAITITATAGKLRAGSAEGGSEFCDGSTTCTITIGTTGDDDDNDLASLAAANPALVGGIFIDLYDVRTAGTATVSATVVAAAGLDPVFSAEPLTVVFSGNAASLSLAETLLRVNAYGTPDADVEADPTADPPVAAVAKDDRDVIKIAVTAADTRGQTADVPRGTPTVLDPDGNAVTSGISASIPDAECNAGRTACNIVIDVNAPAGTPLKSGIYKVRLTSGTLTAAETSFGVAGDPAEITIQLDDPGAVGTSFEADILVVDEAGEPVADGTAVAIAVERRGKAPAAVQRTSPATQRTANGRITARFVVVGREVSTIKATAGSASTLAVANTSQVASPEEDSPAQGLGTTQTNTYTTWSGTGAASAADLLADLGSGTDRIFLWNGVRWLRYAEVNGRPIPGSLNYLIQANDVLWIGTAN